jgi:hypothetical protein
MTPVKHNRRNAAARSDALRRYRLKRLNPMTASTPATAAAAAPGNGNPSAPMVARAFPVRPLLTDAETKTIPSNAAIT